MACVIHSKFEKHKTNINALSVFSIWWFSIKFSFGLYYYKKVFKISLNLHFFCKTKIKQWCSLKYNICVHQKKFCTVWIFAKFVHLLPKGTTIA